MWRLLDHVSMAANLCGEQGFFFRAQSPVFSSCPTPLNGSEPATANPKAQSTAKNRLS